MTKQENTSILLKAPFHTMGILGGTFDPIHDGHIEPTLAAAKYLNLDKLILLPAHIPPHKDTPHADAKQRTEMVELVCQHHREFMCDSRELNSHNPSYTEHTITQLKAELPHTILFFIIGMDSLQTFTTWHQWEKILQKCHLLVNVRPGYSHDNFNEATKALLNRYQCHDLDSLYTKDAGHILIHEGIRKDISSSLIREQIKKNQSIIKLVPPYINDYIQTHHLYR